MSPPRTTTIDTHSPPTILVLGAGAIGALYGALLAQSHIAQRSPASKPPPRVSVVCRSNYPAVSSSGFRLSSPTYGDWTWRPENVYSSPGAAADDTCHTNDNTTTRAGKVGGVKQRGWDYILVSTKALGDDSALLDGLVTPGGRTQIVLVQNGLGVERCYADRFGARSVLSGVTVMSAEQVRPGVVRHNRWTRINVGAFSSGGGSGKSDEGEGEAEGLNRAEAFCELLRDGGVADAKAYGARKLQLLRWHKCALNAAMNPSSVLSGGTSNGAMALDEEMGRHLLGVMNEVLDAAEKVCEEGMPAEFASADKILQSTRKNTSGSRPSMWKDWTEGKEMELEAILGAPIRLAREKEIEMPRLESMYALLNMAQRNRNEAKSSGEAGQADASAAKL